MITEAEEADNDKRAAAAVYQTALDTAKAEYDALQPQLAKMQERVGQLRRLINAASGLLNIPVDQTYLYPQHIIHGGRDIGAQGHGKGSIGTRVDQAGGSQGGNHRR